MMEKVNIPDGKSGDWEVTHFEITEEAAKFANMRSAYSFSCRGSHIIPGSYTAIKYRGKIIMSDTPDEMRDHSRFVREAQGHVLINGLGIGMVLKNVLLKEAVLSVTVNEVSSDVIALVAPSYPNASINLADAYTWKPGKGAKFDAIWHDIWPDKCSDNLPEMAKLHRRYAKWLAPGGYQGSWAREEIKYRTGRK